MSAILAVIVDLLITNLGATSFRTRETAQRNLDKIAPLILDALQKGQKSTSGEIAARCGRLLHPYLDQLAWEESGKMLLTAKHIPWLHLEGCYCSESARAYLDLAHKRGSKQNGWNNGWEDHRVACRLWLQQRLLANTDRATLRSELTRMRDEEAWWWLETVVSYGIRQRLLPWGKL